MNEGKPIPPGEAEVETPAARDGAGAATGASPEASGRSGAPGSVAVGEAAGSEHPAADGERSSGAADGDYELSGPVASDGDYELSGPVVTPAPDETDPEADFEPESSAAVRSESELEGDFELERPLSARPESGALDQVGSEASDAVPVEYAGAGGGARERSEDMAPRPGPDAHPAPAERPRPLHDPDPYGTPPYGEPGPWAPAPPVQHPAVTPAHGTAPMPGLLPGAPVPPGAPGPVPPSSGVPQSAPVPLSPLPQDGPSASASVPSATPNPPASLPQGALAPGTPGADATAPGVPPAPSGQPSAPSAPHPAAAPDPVAVHAAEATYTGPWQNYDPWAPHGPLQQSGAPVATQEHRRRRTRKVLVLGAVLIALVSGGVGGVVGAGLERGGGLGGVQLPQAGPEPKGRAPGSVAGIAARALPSVVTLHVKGTGTQDTGTGFVLDGQGHVLTNNHVVEPAGSGGEISVTFNGGETAKATLVGRDTGYDLAVVKVSGVRGLQPLPLGNSDNVQVGDPVVAIGAPFDLAGTVTAGIVSAKERPITAGGQKGDGSDVSYVDALQTDAPINPGNSGGPLLDSRGRVVGINSAIRSAGGDSGRSGQAGSIGLGFAIPVNQAKRVAEELINTGKATHPVVGVTLDMSYPGDGARVGTKGTGGGSAVTPGGPGDKAGVKPGDVITEVDGVHVHSGEELIVRTRAHRPGDRLELTVVRDGGERRITLVLGAANGN
ncbi:trypsin-like peptidase domain-containing protein [Streptomyces sp. TP-A0356]|uniref:trypsin-like peptidase domain-containing protein n=1 Tax=Streptomyces sp. TP-A0356 TaxID=1359208 RepID=UPI00099E9145|nr:trypsin-like peptidase domain-containing protein [Streptomyces sp. TP-A0356]